MPSRFLSLLPRVVLLASIGALSLAFCAVSLRPAAAQVIELSVNGDPITSVDIDQRMKLLRAIRRPASREAATESMVESRLKGGEASKFGISIADNEIGEQVQTDAKKYKTSAQALIASIEAGGVSQAHLTSYFKCELGFAILIKALNRGVEASEVAVRQELAKEKGKTTFINYTLRQVVFTLGPSDGPEVVASSVKQAEALRTRFTSCATGIPYAKSLFGVAVREPMTRSSSQIPDGFKEVLDKTPIGHLTPPSRSANGIELVALCDRGAAKDDEELRKSIADRLLADHMAEQEVARYKEMRAHAVIQHAR